MGKICFKRPPRKRDRDTVQVTRPDVPVSWLRKKAILLTCIKVTLVQQTVNKDAKSMDNTTLDMRIKTPTMLLAFKKSLPVGTITHKQLTCSSL